MLHLCSTKLQRQRSVHMPTVYRGMFNEIISSLSPLWFEIKFQADGTSKKLAIYFKSADGTCWYLEYYHWLFTPVSSVPFKGESLQISIWLSCHHLGVKLLPPDIWLTNTVYFFYVFRSFGEVECPGTMINNGILTYTGWNWGWERYSGAGTFRVPHRRHFWIS
jgi:hypothetical protein